MTQVATVEKILKDGYVQISVPRSLPAVTTARSAPDAA